MKKLTLIIAIAGIIGLTSCNKEYICTYSENGVSAEITLTDDNYTVCFDDGTGPDCETDLYDPNDDYVTDKASAKNYLEDEGYTCK